jgi:hypothetical protein
MPGKSPKESKPVTKSRVNFVGGKSKETGTAKPKAGLLTKRSAKHEADVYKREKRDK